MDTEHISERQAQILDLVIHEYLATAQPVASGSLARGRGLDVSSATVRSELAALEQAGLLTQPHTSAGRVPTVQGYRYFVEHLMTRAGLSEREKRTILHQFHQAERNADRWMRLSAGVVAHTSGAAGLVASHHDRAALRLYHAGLTEILGEPEFTDGACLRFIVEFLEYGTLLLPVIERLPLRGVEVILGGEPPLEGAPNITLVLSRFGAHRHDAGVVGVIGPTRMPYERAVPAVGYVADLMTSLLAAEAG
jgi:transcriptional regulator of heat shock response